MRTSRWVIGRSIRDPKSGRKLSGTQPYVGGKRGYLTVSVWCFGVDVAEVVDVVDVDECGCRYGRYVCV